MKLSWEVVWIVQNEVFRTHTSETYGTRQAIVTLSWQDFVGVGTALITENHGSSRSRYR